VGIGTKIDTDNDGLPDHWERAGGGIDIDRDDVIDLALSQWGATTGNRDLFIEIDWSSDRTSGVPKAWSCAPAPFATKLLASMFQVAPSGSALTLHVDAGPGSFLNFPFSLNTGSGSLQGGDVVSQPGTGNHLDVLLFGLPGSTAVPANVTASYLDQIKDAYFGTTDKRARELAYRYCVLADFSTFIESSPGVPFVSSVTAASANTLTSATALPLVASEMEGRVVKIIGGTGVGQIRVIQSAAGNTLAFAQPWTTGQLPDATSQYVLLTGSSGIGETSFRPSPNNRSLPGNDLVVSLGGFGVNDGGWLANTCIQWRTMAHELGHTLGLRHGGINHTDYSGPSYLSLMNYSYQNDCPPSPGSSIVQSYSDASDPTFDDWGNIQPGLCSSLFQLGNTFLRAAGAIFQPEENFTVADYEALNNAPVDLAPPAIVFTSPAPNAGVSNQLAVTLHVTDNQFVESVIVRFDVNGDGIVQGAEEILTAMSLGSGVYAATFSTVTGPSGTRLIYADASDLAMNMKTATLSVAVGGDSAGGDLDDDDHDGFKNLIELALGMNPNVPDAAAYPVRATFNSTSGGQIVFTYPRNTSLTNISYAVETSNDLITWSTLGVSESVIGISGTIQTIQATVSLNGQTKAFGKLTIRRIE
jgi:hypothetical protein